MRGSWRDDSATEKRLGVQSSASKLDSSLFPLLQFQRFPEARPLLASAGTALPCIPIPLASSTPWLLHTHAQIIFKECLSCSNNSNYKEPPPLPCKVWYVDFPACYLSFSLPWSDCQLIVNFSFCHQILLQKSRS